MPPDSLSTSSSPAPSSASPEPPLGGPAALALRFLLVAAALAVVALVVAELRLVVLAVALALAIAALLAPLTDALHRRGCPRGLAALIALLGALLALGGIAVLVVPSVVDELGGIGQQVREGGQDVADFVLEGPFGISPEEVDELFDRALDGLSDSGTDLARGALSGALLIGELIAGTLLALVLTFFFLRDGARMWAWLVGLAPSRRREDAEEIGRRSWTTLSSYLRGITVVALFDAVLIGLALAIIGVPAALPLAVLTFFGAYIPFVGAVLTGLAAVLVALVTLGTTAAALVAVAVLVVQQVESNVLHPVVVARAVSLHPVAILLAVTTGAVVAGIIGAIVAVPVTAVVAQAGAYLRER